MREMYQGFSRWSISDWLELSLATWRLTHMIMYERGPQDVLLNFRNKLGIKHNDDGKIVSYPDRSVLACFWCFSIWVSAGVLLVPRVVRRILGLSAVAIIVENRML